MQVIRERDGARRTGEVDGIAGRHGHDGAFRRWWRGATLAASVAALAACWTGHAPGVQAGVTPEPIQVLVHNESPLDVVVFAQRGDQRIRVGEVVAHSSQLVAVPPAFAPPGSVRLMLHQISGQDFSPDQVAIRAGEEHAELRVERELDASSVVVMPGRMR
jgi:hypothetical protein